MFVPHVGRRIAICNRHDCLGRKVKDRVDSAFPEDLFHQRLIAHVTPRDSYSLQLMPVYEFTLRHSVAHQAGDIRAQIGEIPYQPPSQ